MTDKQCVKFGDICREVKLTTKDPLADGYERYIGLEHLDSGSLKIKRWGMIAKDNPSFNRVFKKGNILFGKRRPYLKKAAIAEFNGVCSGDIIVMEPTSKLKVPELLAFLVQSEVFWGWAIKTSSGSLSPRTKFSSLATCLLNIPTEEEHQRALYTLLIKNQEVITQAEMAINSAVSVEKIMAASWFSTTQKKIKHTTLGKLTGNNGLQTGPFGSQLHAHEYSEKGVPVIMPKELGFGTVDITQSATIPKNVADRLSRHRLVEGDFVFGRRGEIGRFGYISAELEGAICGTGCLRFRPKNQNLSGFFRAFFRSQSAIRWLNSNAVGMTMLNLNTDILGELPVPDLSEKDYKKIESVFNKLEAHRLLLNNHKEASINLMNSLINR